MNWVTIIQRCLFWKLKIYSKNHWIHQLFLTVFDWTFLSHFTLLIGSSKHKEKPKKGASCRALVKRKPTPKCVPLQNVEMRQVLLCKMRGWTEWPARVIGMSGNIIEVRFFGDGKTQKSTIANLFSFQESCEKIIYDLERLEDPLYKKAVLEAEIELNIPSELSILNRITWTLRFLPQAIIS